MLEALYAELIPVKNPHAVALGRLGGRKGGPAGGRARAEGLSPKQRSEIARAAALARWGHLPERLRPLFPGYRLEDLRLPDHVDLVMLHVLTRGSEQDRLWLFLGQGGPLRTSRADRPAPPNFGDSEVPNAEWVAVHGPARWRTASASRRLRESAHLCAAAKGPRS